MENNYMPRQINIDLIEVINLLLENNDAYSTNMDECRLLMVMLGAPKLTHCYREQKRVVDLLSKKGEKKRNFLVTFLLAVPPMFTYNAFWLDISRTLF